MPYSRLGRLAPSLEEKCWDELIYFIRKTNSADRISFYLPFKTCASVPCSSVFCETGHFEIDLKPYGPDDIFSDLFKSKVKNKIRRAINEHVSIKEGPELFDDFYKLYKNTNERSNAIADASSNLYALLGFLGGSAKVFCAYHNYIPQSGTLILIHNSEAYYLFAGSCSPIIKGSTNLLQYEIITFLKDQGIETYYLGGVRLKNIEGTKYLGIQKFKESIGGVCIPGYLWKTDINKWKCICYDTLLALKLRMKGMKLTQDYIDSQK